MTIEFMHGMLIKHHKKASRLAACILSCKKIKKLKADPR